MVNAISSTYKSNPYSKINTSGDGVQNLTKNKFCKDSIEITSNEKEIPTKIYDVVTQSDEVNQIVRSLGEFACSFDSDNDDKLVLYDISKYKDEFQFPLANTNVFQFVDGSGLTHFQIYATTQPGDKHFPNTCFDVSIKLDKKNEPMDESTLKNTIFKAFKLQENEIIQNKALGNSHMNKLLSVFNYNPSTKTLDFSDFKKQTIDAFDEVIDKRYTLDEAKAYVGYRNLFVDSEVASNEKNKFLKIFDEIVGLNY